VGSKRIPLGCAYPGRKGVPQGCASLRIHDWCEGTLASKYMRHAVKTFGKAA
jgi:hypothetical protein